MAHGCGCTASRDILSHASSRTDRVLAQKVIVATTVTLLLTSAERALLLVDISQECLVTIRSCAAKRLDAVHVQRHQQATVTGRRCARHRVSLANDRRFYF